MKKKTQKAVLVERTGMFCLTRTVSLDVEPGGSTLHSLQELVKGYIELVRDPELPGLDIMVNEQGRLKKMMPTLSTSTGLVLVGPLVVTKTGEDGETKSLTKDEINRVSNWTISRIYSGAA